MRYKGYLNAITHRKSTKDPERITWEARMKAFKTPDFPDLFDHPVIPEHARCSLPKDLFESLSKSHGPEKAFEIGRTCLERPCLTVRVNTLKTTRDTLMHTFKKEHGFNVVPCKFAPNGIRFLKRPKEGINDLVEYKKGHFEFQDEASQLLAMRVDAKPRQIVLDYCGGSGGKSLAFAPFMQNTGQIYLHDIRKSVLLQAKKRFKRAGV